MERSTALVLAAGSGTRMGTAVRKQYLEYRGKPLLLSSVRAFLDCGIPAAVVTGEEDIPYVKELLLSEFGEAIPVLRGGKERYDSSYAGLRYLKERGQTDLVLIHDAARPFVTEEIIKRAVENAKEFGAAVAAVPSKDTVKIADPRGFVLETPDRRSVYIIQTPQAFRLPLILSAYEKMMAEENRTGITDDASVVEQFTDEPVKLFMGSYENVKITTPEDLKFLR